MMIGTTSRRRAQHAARRRGRSGPAPSATSSSTTSYGRLGRGVERGLAVGHGGHAVALALEGADEHLAQRVVVVDEQDVERRGGLHRARAQRYAAAIKAC